MKIFANSCAKCGAQTTLLRDSEGKVREVDPKRVVVLADINAGHLEVFDGHVLHKSTCAPPKNAEAAEKPEKPKRSKRGLGKSIADLHPAASDVQETP